MIIYDEKGHIFIDRNPKLFSVILDIYRNKGIVYIPPNVSEDAIEKEMDYFLISEEKNKYDNVENNDNINQIINVIENVYPKIED